MKLEELRELLPEFARDIKLNLSNVLSDEGAPGLSPRQRWGVYLACAYAVRSVDLVQVGLTEGASYIDDSVKNAARSAAAIMAMNNVYYRSQHLLNDPELRALPARLRMNVIGRPGIPKEDFELMCFAISAIAGCGQCLTAHLQEIRKGGVDADGAQSAARIASVLNAADEALAIRGL